ncbi:MAG: thiol reductant ABC exporter subunit CydC [Deinococcales bacterium]
MSNLALGAKAMLGVLLGVLTVLAALGLAFSSNLLIVWAGFHPGIESVGFVVVMVRFFGISRAVLRYLERLVSHEVTFLGLARFRVWLFDRLEALSSSQWLGRDAGQNFRRMVGDVELLQLAWLRACSPMLVAFVVAVLSLFLVYWFSPPLVWVALLGYVLAGVVVPLAAGSATQALQNQLESGQAAYSAMLYDNNKGALELHLMGAQQCVLNKLAAHSSRIAALAQKVSTAQAFFSASAQAVAWLTALALVCLGLPLAQSGALPTLFVAAVALGVLASFEAILPLATAQNTFRQSYLAWQRIAWIAQKQPLIQDCGRRCEIAPDARLEFVRVGLHYGQQVVFERLSFVLEPRSWTVLLGMSGVGKTSVARMCLRLLEPSEGQILLGGTPLASYSLEALRNHIALVSQTGYVFAATLRQNLLIARPAASEAQLWAALEQAGLYERVQQLGLGLDTPVTDAAPLSAGERQRLLIARALLRDTPILILDEPTANLDAQTQQQILQHLRQSCQHKTVLCITHRLETVLPTDRVMVLQ